MNDARRWAALGLSALILASCLAPGGTAAAGELRSDVPRAAADAEAGRRAAAALQGFAVDLYRELAAAGSDDIVFSPYSVAVALAMARAGARGETLRQMDAVLRADAVGDLDAGLNALDQALAERPGSYQYGDRTVELELATANRLFGQQGFPFEDAFLDTLAASYGAGLGTVDYVAAREAARQAINDWVAERTKDRIPELIAEGVLDELTRLVITNAIYLKAKWALEFEEGGTRPATWHRLDGSTTQAELMSLGAPMSYVAGDGYQAVRLRYVGGLSMLAIVPDAGTFGAFEQRLDASVIEAVAAAPHGTQVILRFPKFEFRTQAGLKGALSALGMPVAFTSDADLTGISAEGDLYVQEVVHEAFISVDEHGTEAAAATAVVIGATSAPSEIVELTVDRPFVFAIVDDQTGAVLFMGRVLDPS